MSRAASRADSGRVTGSPLPADPSTADVVDLAARRRRKDGAVSDAASSPVRFITEEFLAALNSREVEQPSRRRGHLHAV